MKIKIHYKITIIFAIIIAGTLLGIYLYLNNTLREYTYQRIKANLTRETSFAKSFIEEKFVDTADLKYLNGIADKIGRSLSLRATIISLDGRVLGDSVLNEKGVEEVENHLHRPEIQEALDYGTGEARRFSSTVKKNMLYIASTFGSPEPLGIIRLSMPLSEIELLSGHLKRMLIALLFLAFIFAMIISFIASAMISRPIKQMSLIANSVASGDFSKSISVSTNDEIEDLAHSFNYMSQEICSRIEEISSNRLRLETVLLSMFEGVIVLDAKGAIALMNQTLRDLLVLGGEPVGKKPIEVIRNVEVQEIAEKTLTLDRGVETKEVKVLFPKEKILLVHGTPVRRDERVDGAVLVFHDITELRRFEMIRQDFVANVSHELRTPVASIKGYAETLLEGALEDKKNAHDFLEIIHSDSERLAKLIDDILELSRIESGALKMMLKPYRVGPIVKRALSSIKKQVSAKSLNMEMDIPETLPDILADEEQLLRVFLNLMDNAVKYNKDKGKIAVSASEKGGFIEIRVSDTGIGIPEKDLPRLFERFYRVDKARSRELGGTGLGLSIVKHIVLSHGGEVSVKSALDQGSTFSFTIPKAQENSSTVK
ncbi:MAG: ATP-binding protein [Candidatus Omnitrophota bacterium]